MVDKYEIEIKYGKHGLPFIDRIEGAKLRAEKHEDTFFIQGNSEGLLFLAHSLVALAKLKSDPRFDGYHMHLDDLYYLNDENISIILEKHK